MSLFPLKITLLKGAEITSRLEDLARLRIKIFRDYPYLYDGTMEYEMKYLRTYSEAPESIVVLATAGSEVVGASTATPLFRETEEVQAPFLKEGIPIESVFYYGESILMKEYRKIGMGKRLFQDREIHALSFPGIRIAAFCAVERPDDHPLRPEGYEPLDGFWKSRGYKKTNMRTTFTWKDVNEAEESPKPMVFWMREWDR